MSSPVPPPIERVSDEAFAASLRARGFSRPLRVYVAGASKEPNRVREAMDLVRRAGHEITLDWLAEIEKAGAANEGLDDDDRRHYAAEDLAAVDRADVMWLLAPNNASTGAWVELGFAIAQRDSGSNPRLRVVVSGEGRARCIFASLANYESDTDAAACAWVVSREVPR